MLYPSAPLRRLVRVGSSGVAPIKGTVADEWEEGLFPGYSASGQDVWLPLDQAPFTGDGLVVSAVGARCGKVFLATERWGVTANTAALVPRSDLVDARFLWRVLDNADFWTIGGSAQPYVQMDRSLDAEVPLPPVEEQRRIADFLDDQVARIGELIGLRRNRLGLLGELRSATVTSSITGETTESPLNQVTFRPLRTFLDPHRPLTYGIVQAGPDIPNGVPYIRPVDMSEDSGIPEGHDLLRTTPEIANRYQRSSVEAGDVVMSIGPSFGKVMIVPPELTGANLTQGTARLAPGSALSTRWLYWFLQSQSAQDYWESSIGGATFRALNLGPLGATPTPEIPLQKQADIARHLDEAVESLERQVALESRGISLLEERRRALITAAVTGEMDVTTAKPIGMGKWMPNVGASVEAPGAAQASGIGGIG